MIQATPRQLEYLNAIVAYQAENGYPPTIREIGLRVGVRGTNAVADQLAALERKGYLRTGQSGRARDVGEHPVPTSDPSAENQALRRRVLKLERDLIERDAQITELRALAERLEARLAE